jgi:UPF0755 protein
VSDPKNDAQPEQPKARPYRPLRRLAITLGLVVLAGLASAGYAYHLFIKDGPLAEARQLVVPRGANLDRIAATLAEQGVIESSLVFRLWVRVLGTQGRLRSGEYRFPARSSASAVMDMLIDGRQVQRRFTVPEGLTTAQVLERLSRIEGLEGSIDEPAAEGDLLPDTYTFVLGDTRNVLVQRMKRAMKDALDEAWAARDPQLALKDRREVLILASIIEKETGEGAERPMVAGVFTNRLKKKMRLETDPTVIYGITEGKGALGRRLLRSDLENPHPYNTYKHVGLPPGPIANPGRASIEATVRPAKHNFIYFVADGSGGHAFAETLDEHNKNVQRWRKLRREREERKEN